ncbi:hypothetical protein [Halocola ammonii]
MSCYQSVFVSLLLSIVLLLGCQRSEKNKLFSNIYSGQHKKKVIGKDSIYDPFLFKYGNDTVLVHPIFCDDLVRALLVEDLNYPSDSSFMRIYNSLADSAGNSVEVVIVKDYPRVIHDPDSLIYVYDERYVELEKGVLQCK